MSKTDIFCHSFIGFTREEQAEDVQLLPLIAGGKLNAGNRLNGLVGSIGKESLQTFNNVMVSQSDRIQAGADSLVDQLLRRHRAVRKNRMCMQVTKLHKILLLK